MRVALRIDVVEDDIYNVKKIQAGQSESTTELFARPVQQKLDIAGIRIPWGSELLCARRTQSAPLLPGIPTIV